MGFSSWMARGLVALLLVGVGAWGQPAGGDGPSEAEVSPRSESDPGIALTMTPEEMARVMYIEPNQTKSANLTVFNLAEENATILLNISAALHGKPGGTGKEYNGTGWKVWLEWLSLDLGVNRSEKVKVTVRGPKTGDVNDYIDVTINATSRRDWQYNESVSFRVYLSYCSAFTLKCADKVHTASWYGTSYEIEIHNPGPMDKNVSLTSTGPPGWEYYLDRYNVTVGAGESEIVMLTVIPPLDAMLEEVGMVVVTGRDTHYPDMKASVTTHTIAHICMWLELAMPEPEACVDPGQSAVFTLFVSNYGNLAGSVNVSLSLNMSSPDWGAAFETDQVAVAGMETKVVNLTVTAPADARAGSRFIARAIGKISEHGFWDDCTATVVVNRVRTMNISTSPDLINVRPGETATCDLTVRNDGNADEKFRPEIPSAPNGLEIVLKWPNGTIFGPNDWAYLEPGSHFTWLVVFTAGSKCVAGGDPFQAQIRFVDNSTFPFELKVRILRTFGLDLRAADFRQVRAPGGRAVFDLVCENTGNGPENVMFSVTGLPAGWQTPLFSVRDNDTGGRIPLNPFGQARFAVEMDIPPTATCGTVELTLTAFSHSASSDQVRLFIDVRMPNLLISSVHFFPHTLRLTRETTITVTVWNTGGIAAENISVRFYDNNKTAGNDRLARLPAGSILTVTFIWLPKVGTKELKFVADPDNLIIESNEQDNTVIENIVVYNPPEYGEPPFELCLVPLGFLVLAVVVFTLRSRKA
jgi:uncharacterized membrane protein